ncbi:MAG: hypothetical protein IPN79_14825 [Saprospiraceae bacterium]|nr:hypothetical protein [Saprospiraceae bacterium]
MERKRPVINSPEIEVIFEASILKHFYKEVLLFYDFIDENIDDWVELNDKKD